MFLQSAGIVPIGRHDFKYRPGFLPRVPLTLEKCTSVPQWPRVSHGAPILEIHGKQDQREAAEGRGAGE